VNSAEIINTVFLSRKKICNSIMFTHIGSRYLTFKLAPSRLAPSRLALVRSAFCGVKKYQVINHLKHLINIQHYNTGAACIKLKPITWNKNYPLERYYLYILSVTTIHLIIKWYVDKNYTNKRWSIRHLIDL
jgi:hypothetical protein